MEYLVKIEKSGIFRPVGSLSEKGFQYSADYPDQPDAKAISVSLPLQKELYSQNVTKCFFEGLLPEGFSRKSVASWMRVSEDDYISMLAGLGKECLGAIVITDGNETEEAGYRKLSISEVKALAAEGATRSAKLVTESHLSLTGASGKTGLFYDRESGEWYQPYGTAPSTHIVKQSHIRLKGIVVNELLCLRTAAKCGIDVPECSIIDTGGKEDGDILLATKRYDRTGEKGILDGLSVPFRLHQEDFAQALGIASADKYEPEHGDYLAKMFDGLRKWSSDPLSDRMKLWDIVVFNYLIGNTDSHLKNVSLLYNKSISGIRLAPAYDMVSTTVYESCTRRLSMRIGSAGTVDEADEVAFRQAAHEVHISEKTAIGRLFRLMDMFEVSLKETARELSDSGYTNAAKLSDRILQTGGFGHFYKPVT